MNDYRLFDEETPDDKLTRRERAAWYHAGPKVTHRGLTAREVRLLDELRQQGIEIRNSWMVNVRTGKQWQHQRAIQYAS